MKYDPNLPINSIVQVSPKTNKSFGGCLVVVEKVVSWGISGYVVVPDKIRSGMVFVRMTWAQIEPTGGMIHWTEEAMMPETEEVENG